MVKQKFMYLLCLLMFAVGINAQTSIGTEQNATGSYRTRQAILKAQSYSYNPDTKIITFNILVEVNTANNNRAKPAQLVSFSQDNLNIQSVTFNNTSATRSKNSGQRENSGEISELYYITSGGTNSMSITITAKAINESLPARLTKIYGWQADNASTVQAAAGHLNNPIATTHNWFGIVGNVSIDVQSPTIRISQTEINVFRGENYPSDFTIIATDNTVAPTITYDSTPEGGRFVETTSGRQKTLTLGGTVALNRTRINPNETVISTHTITATDGTKNQSQARLSVKIRPQTDAYEAGVNATANKTFNLDETTPTPESLVSVTKITSNLNNIPQNATYTYITVPRMNQVGTQTVKIRVTYEDNSYDDVDVVINIQNPICTKPANTTGTALNTIVGITDLGRAESNGNLNDDTSWPMMRKGGWLALESNNKGFVVTRMTTAQITAISTPQEGMMVYDTTAKCLKLYDGTKWSCFTKLVCPKLDF